MLRTRQGQEVKPYDILPACDKVSSVEIYLIHRGTETKSDVAEPLSYLLKCVGVRCFCDTLSEEYSMPLGGDKRMSMRKGLSFCEIAVVILSDGFCDSPYCVREVNTILHRESQTGKNILVPALYSGSLMDPIYQGLFESRSTLIRKAESL